MVSPFFLHRQHQFGPMQPLFCVLSLVNMRPRRRSQRKVEILGHRLALQFFFHLLSWSSLLRLERVATTSFMLKVPDCEKPHLILCLSWLIWIWRVWRSSHKAWISSVGLILCHQLRLFHFLKWSSGSASLQKSLTFETCLSCNCSLSISNPWSSMSRLCYFQES